MDRSRGSRKKGMSLDMNGALEFLNQLATDRHFYFVLVPLIVLLWAIEKWVFSLSTWVPLVVVVWASFQYGSYQRKLLVEDLNKRWMRAIREASPTTAVEHCEWLNKLLLDIWTNYINLALSVRFSHMVEKRLKQRKPTLIEKIELQEFSLGSSPPSVGLHGVHWSTSGTQRIMHVGFDWDTIDMSIMLLAKLAKPLYGTARIVINNLHIKGDLQLMPILEGKAILYSFLSIPELSIGVAFGSGGSQSLPATVLPGVSSWLVKVFTDTLVKTMVEPRRRCLSLTAVNLRKKAVGGIVYVTVVSASQIARNSSGGSHSKRQQSYNDAYDEDLVKDLQTFVEIELEELTRKTYVKSGSNPKWDSTFNMVLHDSAGILKFNLYECSPGSVKCEYLASCEVKFKYCDDDSTTFWALGPDYSVIAKHAEKCGEVVIMSVPFEGINSGELLVRLVVKEWQFSDGSHSLISSSNLSHQSLNGLANISSRTGRKFCVTVVEAKDLVEKDKSGKREPYVKLIYGKAVQRTRSVARTTAPCWNQRFEFEEIGNGEYLKLKCLYEETFSDENIGVARVNLEGLMDGVVKDVWIPLEKVKSGELRLQIESVWLHDSEGTHGSTGISGNSVIELVVIEAKDLVGADLRGTSDPYVRVHYGNVKRKTKIMYRTLNPEWNQTFEFPEDASPLVLLVKDHNAILAASSIGECVVDYQSLPPNQPYDKWIPLQGVKKGEIHIRITRKVEVLQRRMTVVPDSASTTARRITGQMKQLLMKLQSLSGDSNHEGLSATLSELESLEDTQEEYILQLETERTVLLNKINELGQELLNSSPSFVGPSPSS
ncbi:AT3g18370/MYF24_8 [Dionaea muscipula]